MKAIYKMAADCGRNGELSGIFVEHDYLVDIMLDEEVEIYFGEVLGKHSEIYGSLNKEDIELASYNEEAVRVIEEFQLESGMNPFDYDCNNMSELADKFEFDPDELEDWSVYTVCEKIYKLKTEKGE